MVEDLPRYSHNYWGARNRVGVLMETYSYLTFADRISAARRLVEEVLHFADANAAEIRRTIEAAERLPCVDIPGRGWRYLMPTLES